jgi:hypothetical protein
MSNTMHTQHHPTPQATALLKPAPVVVGIAALPRRIPISKDSYLGVDLLPQQDRPGGNNHLTVPSRIGGQRVYRAGC